MFFDESPPVIEEALKCKNCEIDCSQTDIIKKHIKKESGLFLHRPNFTFDDFAQENVFKKKL